MQSTYWWCYTHDEYFIVPVNDPSSLPKIPNGLNKLNSVNITTLKSIQQTFHLTDEQTTVSTLFTTYIS
jgi:hypothetical protein